MKLPVLRHSGLQRAAALFLLFVSVSGCSFFSKDVPETSLLEQRTAALIALGWGWLHAENVIAVNGQRQGETYAATFEYDVIIDVDAAALSRTEQDRFAAFLPMCADTKLQKGGRCHVSETVRFVKTEQYGWMPELVVRHMPQLLKGIAEWKP